MIAPLLSSEEHSRHFEHEFIFGYVYSSSSVYNEDPLWCSETSAQKASFRHRPEAKIITSGLTCTRSDLGLSSKLAESES